MDDSFVEQGLQGLRSRALLASVSIYAFVLAFAVLTVVQLLALYDGGSLVARITDLETYLGLAALVVFLASAVLVGMWIHRAHTNLYEVGIGGLEFTPGWSVGWFFVPIASLFKPYQAMRELWHASSGTEYNFSSPAPSVMNVWWACYLIGSFIGNYGGVLAEDYTKTSIVMGIVGNGITVTSAVSLLMIIRQVTHMQQARLNVAQTFA